MTDWYLGVGIAIILLGLILLVIIGPIIYVYYSSSWGKFVLILGLALTIIGFALALWQYLREDAIIADAKASLEKVVVVTS